MRRCTVPCKTRENVQSLLQPRASAEDDRTTEVDRPQLGARPSSYDAVSNDGQASVGERIASSMATLTTAERGLAEHLERHRRELAYASAAQVARELGVSASTAVRFAQALGFEGWPALQQALRAELHGREGLVDLAPTEPGFLSSYVDSQMRNLAFLAAQADEMEAAAETLASATTVWTVGDRTSAYVSGFARHFLRMVRPDVRSIDAEPGAVPDHLLDVEADHAVWLVATSRYARRTVRIARHLSGRAPIVVMTDEGASPLLPYATVRLRFATDSVSSLRSDVAAFATAHALVLAVARRVPGARARLERAEALWDEFELFHKEEPR